MIKKFFSICLMFFLMACGGLEKDTGSSLLDKKENVQVKELIALTDELLIDIRQKRIFSSYTPSQQQNVQESLIKIKHSLLKYAIGTDREKAWETLYTYAKQLDFFSFSQIDESIIYHYKNKLLLFVSRTGKELKIEASELRWVLFQTRFSQLAPFTSFSSASDWVIDWALGASYAQVQKSGMKAWLLSPLVDLSLVQKPALRLHQMIRVDAKSGSKIPFNRDKILKTAFKVMVSTNYVAGDPEAAIWEEVPLTDLPASVDFHSSWSEEIDLSHFNSKNVTVALCFDMDEEILGRHYITWRINQFQILGQATGFSFEQRPVIPVLYRDMFTAKKLGENKSVKIGEDVEWIDYSRAGNTEFAKIDTSLPGIDTWLMTPKLKLRGKSPVLKLKEVGRNLVRENFLVKISSNYSGGDPRNSTWKEFKHIPDDYNAPVGAWTDFKSLEMDLQEFVGKDIVIAFQYLNPKGNYTAWEIDELVITGEGDPLVTEELKITYSNEDVDPDIYQVINQVNFAEDFSKLTQIKEDATAASFVIKEFGGEKYVAINSKNNGNTGSVSLVLPSIKLGNEKVFVKIKQAINFYDSPEKYPDLLQVLIGKTTDLKRDNFSNFKKISFNKKPIGTSWNSVESEWLEIDNSFANEEINIIFKYKSIATESIFSAWNLFDFKLAQRKK